MYTFIDYIGEIKKTQMNRKYVADRDPQ